MKVNNTNVEVVFEPKIYEFYLYQMKDTELILIHIQEFIRLIEHIGRKDSF